MLKLPLAADKNGYGRREVYNDRALRISDGLIYVFAAMAVAIVLLAQILTPDP